MPERTFGRTVRYRRTKLGLTQAQLGGLVGRSASTIKAWERDDSKPTDPAVITTLAAVLDFDDRALFEKAGIDPPEDIELEDATVEQALATLAPDDSEVSLTVVPAFDEDSGEMDESGNAEEIAASGQIEPFYTYDPEKLATTTTTQTQVYVEPSYMEDRSQRQLYRVRNLATIVILVGLVIVFLWSYTEAFDALKAWWDTLWSSLRL